MGQYLNKFIFFTIITMIVVMTQQKALIAQEKIHYMPSKIGWQEDLQTDSIHNFAHTLKAVDLGCDFVEIDIRRTKDGKFVSVHNSTVDAYVEGISGKVSDFTLAELKQLNIGKRVGPGWENERIPTFEEILQLCKDQIGIYLDLKGPYVKGLIEIIKKYDMERKIIWYIYPKDLEYAKEIRRNCYKCIPMPDPGPKENIAKVVEEVHTRVIATDMDELNKDYMKIAQRYNIKVIVDEDKGTESEWEQIIELGTDGIQTDHPAALIAFLKNHNI